MKSPYAAILEGLFIRYRDGRRSRILHIHSKLFHKLMKDPNNICMRWCPDSERYTFLDLEIETNEKIPQTWRISE